MIVISNEFPIDGEVNTMRQLLELGVILHIRRPLIDRGNLAKLIVALGTENLSQIVLHQQHSLAAELGINRLHYNSQHRSKIAEQAAIDKFKYSTSTHDINEFNALTGPWNYAFLSPMYASLSKPGYGVSTSVKHQITERQNKRVKLIGLGGIDQHNMAEVLALGADNIALMGAIWQTKQPIQYAIKCQQILKNIQCQKEY
ncbi:hypothetical protein GQF61_01740 [Sphingobacterium sp. DK4209]|uniref:Thiamine phosphate synthase/TenI domain-containing protein n=2 Tax=Sphingobacterium zhuxiongii TaxID=2662364 RepID=A0A5Q0Q8Y9_9SPHI|nr:hypothetical protein [Sphingobacterium sp. DK4209]QGA25886.1 hypothetical protein GFH32_05950 [Sphingobacterium sp. dk4302]